MKFDEIKKLIEEDKKSVKDLNSLNDLKVKYLGKKGLITELNSGIKDVPNENKKEFGMKVNELRNIFNDYYETTKEQLDREELNKRSEFYNSLFYHN